MSIGENLVKIRHNIPKNISLVAVSKTKPTSDILEAYEAGQRVFGENKIQEMVSKFEELPKDIQWHMIGHLQRNKVKYMAHFVDLIHGVDSLKTLKEINKQAASHRRTIGCLLQIKIAKEETKFGIPPNQITEILESEEFKSLENIQIKGFMGMASFTDDSSVVRSEFDFLKQQYDLFSNRYNFDTLSMGMSGDYPLAISCGSNMVRVGSAIFGHRNIK
ncbi:MAG: YggS family pyridoxal phosphate-dependent enzyme [Flavobacteriaceae bacterium]|nr:MAG: YggS family pyridoxal phosphate-dependent enzyme [Flavobacteriaceae bacterium]